MSTIEYSGSKNLEMKETVIFPQYNLQMDDSPDEYGITEEFEELYDEQLPEVDDFSEYGTLEREDRLKAAIAAVDYVENAIVHQNAIARRRGLDPGDEEVIDELRRERLDAQDEGYSLSLSKVWNREFEGERVGSCKERAMTLHALFKEMGMDSEFNTGLYTGTDTENPPGHAWVEIGNFIADPSSIGGVFHKNTDKFREEYRNTGLQLD